MTGIKLGAFDYLTKPFTEEDLLGLVAEAVIRRRADPGTILLVGEDPALLASFAVALSAYVIVATSIPRLAALPDATRRTPLIVVYDCAATSRVAEDLVERLCERYWRSKLLLLTREADTVSQMALSRSTVMSRSHRFDEVLQRIATLSPGLGELSVRCLTLSRYCRRTFTSLSLITGASPGAARLPSKQERSILSRYFTRLFSG